MKIKGPKPNPSALKSKKTSESEGSRGAKKAGSAAGASASAAGSVYLSSAVEEVREIAKIARTAPEVRSDVVELAKADLAAGRMHVDPRVLAEKMAGELSLL